MEAKDEIAKTCPRCGKGFVCYARSQKKCWCEDFFISPENLKRLAAKYNSCLCPVCLKIYSEKS
ncbi:MULTISPECIES: cysteine-rich CWC family protein [unclassified Carboxylicivirga]|uniref:cysteine-rich CWC family protein n=1 Tax=Carboxylicivirga TaxID=1628153 RepID=UPI003D3564AA